MFLKSLEIQGFKSFADKVYFSFSPGVTAIVGPNGSGKSNVVDAIRWVLGEQSAKTLRGAKMEDVIFSGSAGRKPVGMARVTMILDNSQRIFAVTLHTHSQRFAAKVDQECIERTHRRANIAQKPARAFAMNAALPKASV